MRLASVLCSVIAALALAGGASAQDRIALLIGNKAYSEEVGPLVNPHNDVAAIREGLIASGFDREDITIVRDTSRTELLAAVDAFAARAADLTGEDVAFFYYSGHGAARPGRDAVNLIPVDANGVDRADFWYDTVDFDDVIETFQNARSNAAWILAAAACRNELRLPTRALAGDGEKGFGVVPTAAGMLIAFAADERQTARAGAASAVFSAVRPQVIAATGGAQQPVSTLRLNRDPLLGRPGAVASPPQQLLAAPATPSAEELIREAQLLLAAMNYEPGPADGQAGTQTLNAVAAFRAATGLGSGQTIDADLVAALYIFQSQGHRAPAIVEPLRPGGARVGRAVQDRLALVIGNEDYPASVGGLSNAHDDADRIAAALEATGFDVTVLRDADKEAIVLAIDRFGRRLDDAGPDAVGFFYYSGHGVSAVTDGHRQNFLIPARADVSDSNALVLASVREDVVIDFLAQVGARGMFIVIDACRNEFDPVFARTGADKGFTVPAARPGLFIAHATSPGRTAPDDGLFSTALARQLTASATYAERAFTLAFREVAAGRAGYALPTVASALREEFCFVSCPSR